MTKSRVANIIGGALIVIMMVLLANPGYIFFAK